MKEAPITRANTALPEFHFLDNKDTCSFTRNNTSGNVEADLDCSTPLSRTEQELQSYGLIKSILDNRRLKVVHHNLKSTYHHKSLPQRYSYQQVTQVTGQAVVSRQPQLTPACSKTIKSVYTEISESMLVKKGVYYPTPFEKKSLGLTLEAQAHPPRICLSAMINYKFNSVKSQHRFALDPSRKQSKMVLEIEKAKARSQAQVLRQKRIRAKSEASSIDETIQALLSKPEQGKTTPDYLKKIMREKGNEQMIYGHRSKEYESLTKMNQQLSDFHQAQVMISQIKKIAQPQQPKDKSNAPRKQLRLEKQRRAFQRRRQPCQRKKVCSSALFSMEVNDFR